MTNEYSAPKTALTLEDLLWLLDTSLDVFHTSIGTASVLEMREELRRVLEKLSGPTLAHVALFDEGGRITCVLLTVPSLPDTETEKRVRQATHQFETELLEAKIFLPDTEIAEQLKGALSQHEAEPLQEAVIQQRASFYWLAITYGDFLGCTYTGDGLYDVVPLRIDAKPGERVLGKSIGEYPIPILFDVKKYNLESWAEKLVIIGNRWPPLGRLPAMSGVVVFSFESGKDFEEQLREQREKIRLFSWFIFYTAFVFQTYALSQASAEEPRRLREELSREGWIEILQGGADRYTHTRDEADKLDLERLITNLLKLENRFVKRRVLRDTAAHAKDKPMVAEVIRNQVADSLKPSNSSDQELLFSALRHVEALYPYMDDDVLSTYLTEEVIPAASSLLPGLADSAIEWPLEKPEELHGYYLALSALEDAYIHAPSVRERISDRLEAVVSSAVTDDNAKIDERLVATLLLAIAEGNAPRPSRLARLTGNALLAREKWNKVPLEFADKYFAFLGAKQRRMILEEIPFSGITSEQLRRIDEQGKRFEADLRDRETPSESELISVVSSKGGVGKTLIALGLASSLALRSEGEKDARVCLVDLDFFGPTLNHVVGYHRLRTDSIFLNDYIWAKHLPELQEQARRSDQEGKQAQQVLDSVFEGKGFWKDRFEDLSNEDEDALLDKLLVDTEVPQMKVVACSPNPGLQDMMLPFLCEGLGIIRALLTALSGRLLKRGYEYVIFDCPAEFKEVALSATESSILERGKNVIVTTLFEPSVHSLLEILPVGYYAKGRNYLVVNKVRQLDYKYVAIQQDDKFVDDKLAFTDYWATRGETDDRGAESSLSTALLDMLLNIKPQRFGFVPWLEHLNRFLSEPGPFSRDQYQDLADRVGDYLRFITSD